jgi:hypothetical protein
MVLETNGHGMRGNKNASPHTSSSYVKKHLLSFFLLLLEDVATVATISL